jgi:hypothetical protein
LFCSGVVFIFDPSLRKAKFENQKANRSWKSFIRPAPLPGGPVVV